jgi:hypothetical protein
MRQTNILILKIVGGKTSNLVKPGMRQIRLSKKGEKEESTGRYVCSSSFIQPGNYLYSLRWDLKRKKRGFIFFFFFFRCTYLTFPIVLVSLLGFADLHGIDTKKRKEKM